MLEDQSLMSRHCTTYAITVNGRQEEVSDDELSFDGLVDIAFPNHARGPMIVFTITFREAGGTVTEGELDEGQRVQACDGMIVNVTRTDQS